MYTECALTTTAMDPKTFLASDKEDMRNRFRMVIEAEGPILDDLLEKRVLHSYGLFKRGNRIQPFLDEVLDEVDAEKTIQVSADKKEHTIYWPSAYAGKDKTEFRECRIPSQRDITEIPVCEVANLMRSLGIRQKEKLFDMTAKQLGFKKKGSNIRKTFSLAYTLI